MLGRHFPKESHKEVGKEKQKNAKTGNLFLQYNRSLYHIAGSTSQRDYEGKTTAIVLNKVAPGSKNLLMNFGDFAIYSTMAVPFCGH